MKKIGIVGSRRRDSRYDQRDVVNAFFRVYEEGDWIVSGGCSSGADNFAVQMAKDEGLPILIFHPDWRKLGKAAGFVRNIFIAEESDILIACVVDDRTGGTEDTIRKFEKLGKGKAILC